MPFFNHSELWYVNNMATQAGCSIPFPDAEVFQEDNGERFFSRYITETLPGLGVQRHGELGQCLCEICVNSPSKPAAETMTCVTIPATTNKQSPNNNNNNSTRRTIPQQVRRLPTTIANPVINNKQAASQVNVAGYPFQSRFQIATLLPMTCQLPLYFVPPVLPACCSKHREWLTRRKGRPPHHPLCSQR